MFRLLFSLSVLAVCLFLVAEGADAGKKKKKKGKVAGTVLNVEAAKDAKGIGKITIKTGAKKKKGQVVEEGKELTFTVTAETKVERAGKKKEPATPATFADIQKGQRVVITPGEAEGAAAHIMIGQAAKKKTKGSN